MKERKRSTKVVLLVAALVAVLTVLHLCLRPGINSPSWWLTEAVDESFFTGGESRRQEYLLGQVARAQAESGNIAGAIRTVKTIREPEPPFLTRIRKWANDLLIRTGIKNAPPPQLAFFFPFKKPQWSATSAWAAIAAAQVEKGDLAGAAESAENIDRRISAYAEAWLNIATAQANSGDFAAARASAEKMTDSETSTYMAWGKIQIYKAILTAMVKAGDLSQARRMLKDLPERFPRYGLRMQPGAQIEIVEFLAENGNLDDATSVVNDIDDPFARAGAQCTIVKVLAHSGHIDDAKAVAQKIEQGTAQSLAQAEIAYGLAAAGKAPQALKIAESMADANARSFAYLRVYNGLLENGDIEGAKATARQIADLLRSVEAYYMMLTAQLKAGDLAGAQATVALVHDNKKPAALLAIAEAHAGAEDRSRAMDFIALAEEAADAGRAARRPKSYTAIAETQAKIGDIDGAATTIDAMTKGHRIGSDDDSEESRPFLDLRAPALARLRLRLLRSTAKAYATRKAPLAKLWRHVKTLETPLERAHACLGAAEGLIQKQADEASADQ